MNERLNEEEKAELVKKLARYYTYPLEVSKLITALSSTRETRLDLQLKAFAIVGEEFARDNSNTIQIDNLSSKLVLVKAVKDATRWSLKDCKDFVDTIVPSERIPETGVYAYAYKPFKIGPNERITVDQWKAITDSILNNANIIKWHFV